MPSLSSTQASFLDSFLSLASKTIRPADGPSAASSSTSVSPFLPPPSACSPPVCVAQSPRERAMRSIATWTRSSKLSPLRVPAASASATRSVGLIVLSQLDHFARQGLEPLSKRLLVGLLARAEVAKGAHDRALEVRERVGAVLGGELLQKGRPLLVERAADLLCDLLLDRAVTAAVEAVRDPLGELLVAGLERPA